MSFTKALPANTGYSIFTIHFSRAVVASKYYCTIPCGAMFSRNSHAHARAAVENKELTNSIAGHHVLAAHEVPNFDEELCIRWLFPR